MARTAARLGAWAGVGGALRAGRTRREAAQWPERQVPGSWVARCGDAGTRELDPGRVSGIGDPDSAARPQVGSRVGGIAGGARNRDPPGTPRLVPVTRRRWGFCGGELGNECVGRWRGWIPLARG